MAAPTVVHAAINQSTTAQQAGLGAGGAGRIHYVIYANKPLTAAIPAIPTGYLLVPGSEMTGTGGVVIGRAVWKRLVGGDVAPTLNGAGNALMVASIVVDGAIAAGDPTEDASARLLFSATAINFAAIDVATAEDLILALGIYGTSGAGTFGTPDFLSGGANNDVANYVGSNMRGTLWSDEQSGALSIEDGSIPITGGSGNTNRGFLIAVKPEVSTSVTVSNVADERFYHGETDVPITCTGAGAAQLTGRVVVSPTDDISDPDAVAQTIQSWSNTLIVATMDLDTFDADTDLYLFVEEDGGDSNPDGYVIRRALRFRISTVLRDRGDGDDSAVVWASKTGITYSVKAVSARGTEVLGATGGGETDASGNFLTGYYELTEGGPIEDGDYVYVLAELDDPVAANYRGTQVKYLPTYE